MANDTATAGQTAEPNLPDEAQLEETHGKAELAVMVDEDGEFVFGPTDDDLGELYEEQFGSTDQTKTRYVIELWIPKSKTKNATVIVPAGATSTPKVVITA